ncbi:MAG: hypothetical protein A2812_00735 [Candidatus Staskawiczbacteria bacterium RIFCSPHIGHO2_01_FULL_36_16]|uniref:Uncharacterized protein n=1 Tax=Candidatus Staskawiczbacteria bacterium RIFCSPHIGHO2_01_FULL_36_16 TaxID=1802200 RepID=A0A1G2HRI1_9BACT|nr:MAG: hypothetical protein A2812_00735 [Candidatus Staskawiczbacteria bacterium RIFCSPHIGHO2_01_FULL_36_16]
MSKKMPQSTKKFIRREKVRIRRQFLDSKKQKEMIDKLYSDILNKPEAKKEEPKQVKESPKEKQKKEDKAPKVKSKARPVK